MNEVPPPDGAAIESSTKGTLYTETTGQQLAAHSWSVVFLHQFCSCNNYNIVQVDTQEQREHIGCPDNTKMISIPHPPCPDNTKRISIPHPPCPDNTNRHSVSHLPCPDNTNRHSIPHLPSDTPSSVVKWSELPDVVKSCELPALVETSGLVCYSGVCTVLRRMVMDADSRDPTKNLIALLGFRQTRLKNCSEVSGWTQLCEVQAPRDIAYLLKQRTIEEPLEVDIPKSETQKVDILESVQAFETNLSQPVTTFNAVYRQQILKKEKTTNDIETAQNHEVPDKSGVCLKAGYKNAIIITDKRKYKQKIYGKKSQVEELHMSSDLAMSLHMSSDVDLAMSKLSVDASTENMSTISRTDKSKTKNDIKLNDSSDQSNENVKEHREMSSCTSSKDSLLSLDGAFAEAPDAKAHNDTSKQAESPDKNAHHDTSKQAKAKKNKRHRKTQDSLPNLPHTFAEGPDLTIVDLALFPYIQSFLSYINMLGATQVLSAIPLVVKWYNRMVSVPNMVETCRLCRIPVLELQTANVVGDLSRMTMGKKETSCKEGEFCKGKSKKAVKAAIKRELPIILNKLQSHDLKVEFSSELMDQVDIDWDCIPRDVNPCQDVDAKRARNKRNQVESLVAAVKMVAKEGHTIVDFCSGGVVNDGSNGRGNKAHLGPTNGTKGIPRIYKNRKKRQGIPTKCGEHQKPGHVGIVIAYLLPACHVVMIENKEESLRRAAQRVQNIGLTNVTLYQSNIDYYTGTFDVGVSLHACGVATDLVLSKCQYHQAAFVSSPCCYGSLQNTHLITYPRSQRYNTAGITCQDLCMVGHAAEQTSWNFDTEYSKTGKLCMGIIDTDRMYAATEQGYEAYICSLQPTTCSPKNNLLIGWYNQKRK